MVEYRATTYQNELLPEGAADMTAVVEISKTGGTAAAASPQGTRAEIILIDTSGSMGGRGVAAAAEAAIAAIGEMPDGTMLGIVDGKTSGLIIFPPAEKRPTTPQLVALDAAGRRRAADALHRLKASGGTAMGSWLESALSLFHTSPETSYRHVILLTDGRNEGESDAQLAATVNRCKGVFQCDCRGVGDEWEVAQLRSISSGLLGTTDTVPSTDQLPAMFAEMMRGSTARASESVQLNVWAPQGAQVAAVRQVSPDINDLSGLRSTVSELVGSYPTGAWADETRRYLLHIRLAPRAIGQEQLAARVQVVVDGEVAVQSLVKAQWSSDGSRTAQIDPVVAQHTGQVELAASIQEGLAAKAAGDDERATLKLGRAVQLALQAGNEEITDRLRKVVHIEDAETGTVRLRRDTARLDEVLLDTDSTKTIRTRT